MLRPNAVMVSSINTAVKNAMMATTMAMVMANVAPIVNIMRDVAMVCCSPSSSSVMMVRKTVLQNLPAQSIVSRKSTDVFH